MTSCINNRRARSRNKPQGHGYLILDNIIFSYLTKQALQEGVLIAVETSISKEARIKFPVVMSSRVWNRYVEVPTGMRSHQDLEGRLWDVLFMFSFQARKTSAATMHFPFVCQIPADFPMLDNEDKSGESELLRGITLKAVIGPRDIDDPRPGIFILFPDED